MTEIVKPETFDSCPFEQILETPFHTLPSACCAQPRRKNPIIGIYRYDTKVVIGRSMIVP